MAKQLDQLSREIMRRVYYAYALRLSLHPTTVSLLVFAVSLYALAKLVFVARVVESFLETPLGEIVPHTLKVLTHADTLTLVVFTLCLGAVVYAALNLRWPKLQYSKFQTI